MICFEDRIDFQGKETMGVLGVYHGAKLSPSIRLFTDVSPTTGNDNLKYKYVVVLCNSRSTGLNKVTCQQTPAYEHNKSCR